MKIRFGVIAGIFLTLFSIYPQMKLWYTRGAEWQGNYAYNDIDEVAYASYLRALIDGRPRKNDPYSGRDDSREHPQPESLFSIQFAAPYTLAIPGRVFGISAPWMMTIGGATAAFLTALLIFWLLFRLTGNNWFSMAGSLVTLAGGAVFAGEGAMLELFFDGFSYPYFPGFRRYIPALAMPAFFGFVGLVWVIVGHGQPERTEAGRLVSADQATAGPARTTSLLALAIAAFAYTVFSYFYIWTTAAAWLGTLAICWAAGRPPGASEGLRKIVALGLGCAAALIPYAYLLSLRTPAMDEVQLLVYTRAPDLTRFPEYISVAAIVMVAFGGFTKKFDVRSPRSLFVLSLAMTCLAVFNQQVITGRSLQPIHYQVFIGNYVAGLALVSAFGLFVNGISWTKMATGKAVFTAIAAGAVLWGLVECRYTVRVLDHVNYLRDEQMPMAARLTELARAEPDANRKIVFHIGIAEGDDLPTIAPQATLWARHQHVFAGLSQRENKERYYQWLYFQGVTERQLADSMKEGDFVSMIALFGWGRHTDRLNSEHTPLTFGEIDLEARRYGDYIRGFDPRHSPETMISYVVITPNSDPDLTNLDRWYFRDEGEKFGRFTLYKVTLKPQ